MSISTYAELQAAVNTWLHRADLASIVPDFIALAEVRIFNGGMTEPVRISAMQNQDAGTISSQSIALPSGYLETLRLSCTTGGQSYPLEYLSPSEFSVYENQAGNPQYYTVINNQSRLPLTVALPIPTTTTRSSTRWRRPAPMHCSRMPPTSTFTAL